MGAELELLGPSFPPLDSTGRVGVPLLLLARTCLLAGIESVDRLPEGDVPGWSACFRDFDLQEESNDCYNLCGPGLFNSMTQERTCMKTSQGCPECSLLNAMQSFMPTFVEELDPF